MNFDLQKSIEILERTPDVLSNILFGISDEWIYGNEGPGTWSPYDVVGHLIFGEETDWIPRMDIILSDRPDKTFVPFDRFGQQEKSKGKSMVTLLHEFKEIRKRNVNYLLSKNLSKEQLLMKGIHPAFGEVTLEQLLATWVVHDLNHIAQISRAMAKQYKIEVGPWIEYLRILKS